MDNYDLFADHDEIGQLADRLDQIPTAELKDKWPSALADLVDVMTAELTRVGVVDASGVARKLAFSLASYMGGRAYYIPTNSSLTVALRDHQIFEAWLDGRGDVDALSRQYGVSQPQLYSIIATQRKLHRRRHQHDMFEQM